MIIKHMWIDKSKKKMRFKKIFQARNLNSSVVSWGEILSNAILMKGDKYGTRTY